MMSVFGRLRCQWRKKNDNRCRWCSNQTSEIGDIIDDVETVKVTEAEAKEKYPNFKWVSLEELENEN